MTNLQSCIVCGALISKSAHPCPKCKTYYPWGVHCSVCGDKSKPIPEKEALSSHNIWWYHPECAKRMLSIPADALCRDCRTPLASFWDWETIFKDTVWDDKSCPNCGARRVLVKDGMSTGHSCYRCHLPVLWLYEVDGFYHAACHAMKKEAKDIEERLRREEEDIENVNLAKQRRSGLEGGMIGALIGFVVGLPVALFFGVFGLVASTIIVAVWGYNQNVAAERRVQERERRR